MPFTPPSPDTLVESTGFIPPPPNYIVQTEDEKNKAIATREGATVLSPWEAINTSFTEYAPAIKPFVRGGVGFAVGGGMMNPKGAVEGAIAANLPSNIPVSAGAGITQGVADQAEALFTPLGVSTLGIAKLPQIAQRAVAVSFTALALKNAPKMWTEFRQAVKYGDQGKAARAFINMGGNALMGVAGAAHAVSKFTPPHPVEDATPASPLAEKAAAIEPVAPLTAEAVKQTAAFKPPGPDTESATVEPPAVQPASVKPDIGAAGRLQELKAMENPTPEQAAERDALQAKSDSVKAQMMASFRPASAEPVAPKKLGRPPTERPPDIIDHITENYGGIKLKSAAKPGSEGHYTEGYNQAVRSRPSLFSKSGSAPNEIVDNLRREGKVGEDFTVDDLWDAINNAHTVRGKYFRGEQPEQKQAKFNAALSDASKSPKHYQISVGDLSVGDKFKLQGEEFEVRHIDPDTGEVQVKDGKKFGSQVIPDGEDIPINKGSLKQVESSVDFVPPEPESLVQPSPKLAPGVNQGDLISSTQKEDLSLTGEKGTDAERLQAAKAKAEADRIAGEEDARRRQLELQQTKPATPEAVLKSAKQIVIKAPEGATQIRIADAKGRESVMPLSQVNKGDNPFRGVDITKIEAGTRDKAGKFQPMEGSVSITEKSKPLPPGPGAATRPGVTIASDIGQFESNIPPLEKLADAVGKFPVQKGKFSDQLKQWLSEVGQPLKDKAEFALTEMKASSAKMIDALSALKPVSDLERRVGVWDADDQTGSLAAQRFSKAVRQRFPNRSKLRAFSNWINAGGEKALIQEWADQTKDPVLRKTYEDALKFGPEEEKLARDIRQYHDEMLAWALREGALEAGVEDFLHRYYPNEKSAGRSKTEAALQYLRFTKDFKGFKKRFYESDFDAEQAGKIPEKDAAKRILAYDQGFRRALTARAFVKSSYEAVMPDGRPELDVMGTGEKVSADEESVSKGVYLVKPKFRVDTGDPADYRGDYVSFDHPAFRKWKWASVDDKGQSILMQGEIAVHPDAARKYAALFEKSWWRKTPIRRAVLGVSSTVKQTMLDLSGFHPVQIAIHAVEHKVNPFRLTELNPTDPAQRELMEGGLSIADTKGAEIFSEGVFGTGVLQKIPVLGEKLKLIQDAIFKDFIPRIKMTMAQGALERNLKRYAGHVKAGKITREQLVRLTAREANAAFGEQNYRAMFRHPSTQDSLRFAFLAPDFGEARLRFPLQALTIHGREQLMALGLGAVGMMTIAKLTEQQLTGKVDWKKPFTVTYKGREYGLRNVASDIYHLVTDPQGYLRNRLNPIYTRPVLEFLNGRDSFGRKRTITQQLLDEAKQIIPISLRGSIEKEQTFWESFANAMGITEHRASAFGNAMKSINAWKDKKGYTDSSERVYDPDKDPYHPLTSSLSTSDSKRATRELNRLLQGKTDAQRQKIYDHYKRALAATKYLTGSKAHESEYLKESGDQAQSEYNAATKERLEMWKTFQKAWAQKSP